MTALFSSPTGTRHSAGIGTPHALYIDAGVCHVRIQGRGATGAVLFDRVVPSNADLRTLLRELPLPIFEPGRPEPPLLITGRLGPWVRETLGRGRVLQPAAAAWLAAREQLRITPAPSLGLIEISASGYLAVGLDADGELRDDLLLTHPRCGAGSGVNLDRILEKLGLARAEVDALLADYAGEAGQARRAQVHVRADRCGVFASSATISDKNQGIPLAVALATTLKSEVLKACRKLPAGFDTALLTGRFFHFRFARECAEDELRGQGVRAIACDPDNGLLLAALARFGATLPMARIAQPDPRLLPQPVVEAFPAFEQLKSQFTRGREWLRLPDTPAPPLSPRLAQRPLRIGLDVGSTMAKVVMTDAEGGETLFRGTYSNAGDTIETLRRLFRELDDGGIGALRVQGIGITGSARYQVKEALAHLYPDLAGRLFVLVENYAHARGSIALAREHAARLRAEGIEVETALCILVDIGGEDTKISTLALAEAELLDNAMNLKCSAGTGSLMDTLAGLFGLSGVVSASAEAQAAPRAPALDATCAVFLMEHARRLQVQGVPRAEILASAAWAIVENMARSLWPQLELPPHAVVLLHGQTMCSDPLPLAVIHRMQRHLEGPVYGLIPPHPGHRACLGLIHTLAQTAIPGSVELPLAPFLAARFDKRLIECRGAACNDPQARCNRTHLRCGAGAQRLSFTLGGCGAINELLAKGRDRAPAPPAADIYKTVWEFVDNRLPRSGAPDRLVIARSFAVSEWSFLLARILAGLGLPVHVDNVCGADLAAAQPLFNVDTCAPHMGAVGQYRRLAGAPHGMILAPQIESLPTGGASRGWACTLNQGGVAVAANLAQTAHPGARIHLLHLDLGTIAAEALLEQLGPRLAPVFRHYGIAPDRAQLHDAISRGIEAHQRLRHEAQSLAAQLAHAALDAGRQVALVVGREYILNPGIYDSHVRRLLQEHRLAVLPSWLLDVTLDREYGHIYWRNAHAIVTLLDAVSRRRLHERIAHPELRRVFERIEGGEALLPVVQVSTFSCGPDSIIQPTVAEVMKQRPFLLIQSDAVLKELAHLENRVNTYLKQLAPGAQQRPAQPHGAPFEVRTLDQLDLAGPLDPATDVIYFPTLDDNGPLTAVLRGAGFVCIDNYDERSALHERVRLGRQTTGDAVCAPLAAVYGDLERAIDDFAQRRAAGDPLLVGKRRLLFFEIKGAGPCRQGLYTNVHQVLFQRRSAQRGGACNALPGNAVLKMLAGREYEGFNIGMPEWVLARAHQATILQGVLHSLLFAGAERCRTLDEYRRLRAEWRALKAELYRRIEHHTRPGPATLALLRLAERSGVVGQLFKFAVYSAGGRPLLAPLRQFARRWLPSASGHGTADTPTDAGPLRILLTGEIYMRISQADAIHRTLLGHLGFGRFRLDLTPAWSYLEYALDEDSEIARERIERVRSRGAHTDAAAVAADHGRIRRNALLRLLMRRGLAAPLYRAAGLPMPHSSRPLLDEAKAVLPTLRPLGELLTYVGETLHELAAGTDLILNVAPNGCMVSTMGDALTPRLAAAGPGRIQPLFSADGSVDEEMLTLALLKVMGPEAYHAIAPEEARATTAV